MKGQSKQNNDVTLQSLNSETSNTALNTNVSSINNHIESNGIMMIPATHSDLPELLTDAELATLIDSLEGKHPTSKNITTLGTYLGGIIGFWNFQLLAITMSLANSVFSMEPAYFIAERSLTKLYTLHLPIRELPGYLAFNHHDRNLMGENSNSYTENNKSQYEFRKK